MTHKELLAKLWILPADVTELQHGAKAVQALRAIVELHKPCRLDKDMTYCEGCSNSAFFPWKFCPTIQAIEKELNQVSDQ